MGNCCVRDSDESAFKAESESPEPTKAPNSVKSQPAPSPTPSAKAPSLLISHPRSTSSSRMSTKKDPKSFFRIRTPVPSPTGLPVKKTHQELKDLYEIHGKTAELACGILMVGLQLGTQTTRLIIKTEKRDAASEREIRTKLASLAPLSHPNLMKFDTVLDLRHEMYLISEPFDREKFIDHSIIAGKQSEPIVKRLALQLIRALTYLHSKSYCIQRLSIQNIIFFKGNDENILLKVIAMSGPSKPTPASEDTLKKQLIHTAPEAVSGEYNEKSDIWNCGVLIYSLLRNTLPFDNTLSVEELQEAIAEGVQFPRKKWERVNPQAKSLLSAMLAQDPSNRPAAAECLAHPWLQDFDSTLPTAMPEVMANLRTFQGGDPLKLAILTFIALNALSLKEKQLLQEVFAYINTSGTGLISPEELSKAFAQVHIAELSSSLAADVFRAIDIDRNGTIEFPEFLLAGANYKSLLKHGRLKLAFDLLDPDHSESITVEEFKAVLKYQASDQVWRQLMQEVDKDKSGAVDFMEFKKLVKTIVGTMHS